jgi:hypothetical protein
MAATSIEYGGDTSPYSDVEGAWSIILWQEGYLTVEEFASHEPERYAQYVNEVIERFSRPEYTNLSPGRSQ